MNLRERISNSQVLLDRLPEDQRLAKPVVKLFGLAWNRIEDCMWIADVNSNCSDLVITKRDVLWYVAIF